MMEARKSDAARGRKHASRMKEIVASDEIFENFGSERYVKTLRTSGAVEIQRVWKGWSVRSKV